MDRDRAGREGRLAVAVAAKRLAVEAAPLAREERAHEGRGLAYAGERLRELHPVPLLHHGLARRTEAEDEPPPASVVKRIGGGREDGGGTRVDGDDGGPDPYPAGRRPDGGGERERVDAARIGKPDVVEAFFLGPAGMAQGGFDPGLDGNGDRDALRMAQIESTPKGISISSGDSPPWSPGWRLSNRPSSYHQTARPG